MATVRPGRQAVLLVVDAQAGVMAECREAGPVLERIAATVQRARAAGVPVLWVQHADEQLAEGSPGFAWAPPLAPAAGEPGFVKRFNSAFEQTALEATLAGLGATELVLAGAATNFCIRATAYAALERGYDLTLVADAHATGDFPLPDGSTLEAAPVVRDLNAVLPWLQYPGRHARAMPAATIVF